MRDLQAFSERWQVQSWSREEQLRGLKCSGYDLLARSDVRRRLVRDESCVAGSKMKESDQPDMTFIKLGNKCTFGFKYHNRMVNFLKVTRYQTIMNSMHIILVYLGITDGSRVLELYYTLYWVYVSFLIICLVKCRHLTVNRPLSSYPPNLQQN